MFREFGFPEIQNSDSWIQIREESVVLRAIKRHDDVTNLEKVLGKGMRSFYRHEPISK